MRKLSAICKRLRRRYGAQFAVIPPRRGVYRVYMFSSVLGDWFPVRTCAGVAEAVDYLLSFECVKEGVL